MCATFRIDLDDDDETLREIARRIEEKYGSERLAAVSGRDLFPKSEAPVRGQDGVGLLTWGFPMEGDGKVVFNARSETVLQKPMFRSSLSRRCAIPATSFYEWDHRGARPSRVRIRVEDEPFFYMAGLWRRYLRNDGSSMHAFVLLTTAPNAAIAPIHDRMPAILLPSGIQDWIGGEGAPEEALGRLGPFPGAVRVEAA